MKRKWALLSFIPVFTGPLLWLVCKDWFLQHLSLSWAVTSFVMAHTLLVVALFIGLIDRLHRSLDMDNLTVLLNQPSFFRLAEAYFHLGIRHGDFFSIIMIDLDHFKKVNDQYNHLAGSAILKQIGQMIKADLRSTDLAARFGGDEFIICLPRTSLSQSRTVADRIREQIESTEFTYKNQKIHQITASFGVTTTRCCQQWKLDSVVEYADSLLYQAKKEGRNRVCAAELTEHDQLSAG